MSLQDDAKLARENNLKFEVTTKPGRSLRWETVKTDIADLEEALSLAQTIEAYEVGIFVVYPGRGGFLYWTSRFPELLNDSVINLKFLN